MGAAPHGERPAAAAAVLLVVAALPLVRPNLLGESLSVVGFALLVVAALLVVLTRPSPDDVPRARVGLPAAAVVVCLGLAYAWLVVRAAVEDPGGLGRPALQGTVLTAGSVLALVVVCAEPRLRLAVGRAVVLVTALACASFVVTALVWAVAGTGTGVLLSVPIGTAPEPQPIYLPLTPTLGSQAVLGVDVPRFTGLGREPGWMAMYCAVAFFLADAVGLRRRWIRLVLVAGLLGCVSTAGFGVFVVAYAFDRFLRDRGTGITVGGFLRQLLGLAATAGAVWLAVTAPVLGLSAKTTQNARSLDERLLATRAGLRALTTDPWGGPPTEVQGGINMISDVAVSGLPFVVLVAAALLLPVALHRGPARSGNAVVLVVLLTLLISQPPKDSTWAFAVVALAVALRQHDGDPPELAPVRPDPLTTARPEGAHEPP